MLEKFARYPLTFGPTPIEKLNRLGVHLGGKVELYTILPATSCSAALGGRRQAGRRRLLHRQSLERAIEEVKAKGGKPYAIPAGASMQLASPRMAVRPASSQSTHRLRRNRPRHRGSRSHTNGARSPPDRGLLGDGAAGMMALRGVGVTSSSQPP
jgi:1-aminocyclopropane-1-carboxylate deaminase/D-cysteine desulfhydrase-like pyridoxal-dependent ACC family enzyme